MDQVTRLEALEEPQEQPGNGSRARRATVLAGCDERARVQAGMSKVDKLLLWRKRRKGQRM